MNNQTNNDSGRRLILMDIIYINGIRCSCIIGVWPWEREVKQTLVFDLQIGTDFSTAAKSDDLADAIDYQRVTERLVEIAETSEYQLIEALICVIADQLIVEFNFSWLRLQLDKGAAVKPAKNIGLVVERGQRPA